jgi:RNA polymerase sigma-B factor
MDTYVSHGEGRSGNGGAAGRRDAGGHDGPDDRGDDDDVSRLLGALGALPVAERRRSGPRELIIVGYLPLVERLARRFARAGVARDELVQAGAVGLILAVDRFDARRGVPFVAYAIPTIVGSIQRYLRDAVPIVRAPRRRDGGAPAEAGAGGAGRLWRTRPAIDAVHVTLLGDWQDLEARPGRLPPFAYVDPALEDAAEHLMVARRVRSLGPRDRQLIYLRFYEDESLAQIAERMGLSVSRVSRLLTRALATLRDELETPEEGR